MSATRAEPAWGEDPHVSLWYIYGKKRDEICLSVNRKANYLQPKQGKPSHHKRTLEILACFAMTCRSSSSKQYHGWNPSTDRINWLVQLKMETKVKYQGVTDETWRRSEEKNMWLKLMNEWLAQTTIRDHWAKKLMIVTVVVVVFKSKHGGDV